LPQPRYIGAEKLMSNAERQQGSDRIAVVQARGKRRLVGGRRQTGEASAVRHHAIEHREVRGCVVELDVTGERRVSGEHGR
jgi:hypothetical protein